MNGLAKIRLADPYMAPRELVTEVRLSPENLAPMAPDQARASRGGFHSMEHRLKFIAASAPFRFGAVLGNAPRRCRARTRAGGRCKGPAVTGSIVCRMHGGAAILRKMPVFTERQIRNRRIRMARAETRKAYASVISARAAYHELRRRWQPMWSNLQNNEAKRYLVLTWLAVRRGEANLGEWDRVTDAMDVYGDREFISALTGRDPSRMIFAGCDPGECPQNVTPGDRDQHYWP